MSLECLFRVSFVLYVAEDYFLAFVNYPLDLSDGHVELLCKRLIAYAIDQPPIHDLAMLLVQDVLIDSICQLSSGIVSHRLCPLLT